LQAFVAEDGVCAQEGWERVGVFAAEGVFREAGEKVAVDHQADFGGEGEEGGRFLGKVVRGGVAAGEDLVVCSVGRGGVGGIVVVAWLALFGGGVVWVAGVELLVQNVLPFFDGDAKDRRGILLGEREAGLRVRLVESIV
jgi:hypothetical protein